MGKIEFALNGGPAMRTMEMSDDEVIAANRTLVNQRVHFFTNKTFGNE